MTIELRWLRKAVTAEGHIFPPKLQWRQEAAGGGGGTFGNAPPDHVWQDVPEAYDDSQLSVQALKDVAKDVRAAALDEAAATAENEHVGASVDDKCNNEKDGCYNMALRHAASAIRDLKTAQEQAK